MRIRLAAICLLAALLCPTLLGASEGTGDVALPEATFTVAAKIYGGREDERQTALSTKFYVFKKSFVEILKIKHFTPTDASGNPLSDETAYLEAFAAAVEGDVAINAETEEATLLGWLIESAIAENRIAVIKTGADGNSRVKQLPAGDYHLFGYARFDDEIFVWNQPFKLSGEPLSMEIDQYNADAVISTDPPNYFADFYRQF